MAISRFKHMSTNAPAHCYGEQCIQYHAQQLANTSVPVGFLRDTISMLDRQANYVAEILEEVKVPHIKVLYERLFYAKNAEEWMNIFRFVGVGPMTGLEMAHVRAVRQEYSGRLVRLGGGLHLETHLFTSPLHVPPFWYSYST